jgi:hypothetical protein
MDDTDTKHHLLEMANNFFIDFGIHFTIKPLQNHHVTKDNVYTLHSNKCSIYLAVCPGEYIYIDNLEKCGSHSGSVVLERIKSFGKFLGLKYIKLYDAAGVSSNTCDFIAFAPFTLYTKGKTWYQLHGFNYVSDPHGDIDYSGSKTIPFRYFLDRRDLIEFQKLFPDILLNEKDKTIGKVMIELQKKYLHRGFTQSLSKAQCKVLSSITLDLYEKVLPDESMIYTIPYGTSRSKTKSKSKSKTKSKTKPKTRSITSRIKSKTIKKILK